MKIKWFKFGTVYHAAIGQPGKWKRLKIKRVKRGKWVTWVGRVKVIGDLAFCKKAFIRIPEMTGIPLLGRSWGA